MARWGGEEITVLAPGIRSRRGLEQFAERIRRLIGDVPITGGRNRGGDGIGRRHPARRVARAGEAVHRADTAMYEAKRRRNAYAISLPSRTTQLAEAAS